MPLRPYEPTRYELPVYLSLLIAACVLVVLFYAPGCHVDSKPRGSTWSPYQPPVVVHADEDGGPR